MTSINPKRINVLIACEESQIEAQAFREAGFNAYSCDIQRCRPKANPAFHIRGDVTTLLAGRSHFQTQDGKFHRLRCWHLIIAHPPCTYLCKVSSVHMMIGGVLQQERYQLMIQAREFFFRCLNANAPFVAVENPLPMARAELPRPDTFIQPFWFGHPYSKKTLFWLRNLPPLMPDCSMACHKQFVRSSRGKYRSRSFPGVAKAMATQWGEYVIRHFDEINNH